MQDLKSSGDGAMAMGVMDRRTFKLWAKKAGVEPTANWHGDDLYDKKDVDKVVATYKKAMAAKKKNLKEAPHDR